LSAVQVRISTFEYEAANFSWYEIYSSQTPLDPADVIADAEFRAVFFGDIFLHAGVNAGEEWFYWVRAQYDLGATDGTLAALGSIIITGSAATSGDGGGCCPAIDVAYDNTASGLTAVNVQDAIDELEALVEVLSEGTEGDAGAGAAPFITFSAFEAMLPTANYPQFDARNLLPVIDFDQTTGETCYFLLRMPDSYAGGSLIVSLSWMATTATSGTIGWTVAFARLNDANQDVDSYAFDTASTITAATVSGTAGKITTTSVTVANGDADLIAAGDLFILRVVRDVANDTCADDAEFISGKIVEA